MSTLRMDQPASGLALAVRHSLGWLVLGNLVGLYLSVLLLYPDLQIGAWTYGRWMPVHLNVQLYGWTSLPLVAWLLWIYEVDRSKVSAWGPAAVWAWSAALALGAFHWLGGTTSGKIFLDWKGGPIWAFLAAMVVLWCLLALAWRDRSATWHAKRRRLALAGLIALALVPLSLVFAASPAVYPPVDRTTGGPTGSSLMGSTLVVVGLMLMLPRVAAGTPVKPGGWGIWAFFGVSWIVFGVTEAMGGTHHDAWQIGSLAFLLPWVLWLPIDWARFSWPVGAAPWRMAVFGWWGLLVISGLVMYFPGLLDHLKFTQGLVAHSHLAMAGFTTSFCALLLVLLTGSRMGAASTVALWHAAALVMVVTLAVMGWLEGDGPSWMLSQAGWRETGFLVRTRRGRFDAVGFGAVAS